MGLDDFIRASLKTVDDFLTRVYPMESEKSVEWRGMKKEKAPERLILRFPGIRRRTQKRTKLEEISDFDPAGLWDILYLISYISYLLTNTPSPRPFLIPALWLRR